MVEHCAFGMKVRRLCAGDSGGYFRQHLFEQTALAEQLQASAGVRCSKQPREFLSDAFGANLSDADGAPLDGGKGFRLDLKIKLRRQAYGAEEPKVVFGKALGRRADGTDHLGVQIGPSADPIMQLLGDGVVIQS